MYRIPLMIAAVALSTPVIAQTTAPATQPASPDSTAAAAAPAKPNVVTGAQVVDTSGAAVGTIESVAGGIATLSTGTTKVGIPTTSFAANGDKLVLAMTKAQVDAQGAPAAASGSASASAAGATAAAPGAATIAVGVQVNDQTGAKVGTVKAVNGDMVTVASATASAQLPKKSFAANGDALVIGLTAAQFEAAAKAAGGAKTATNG